MAEKKKTTKKKAKVEKVNTEEVVTLDNEPVSPIVIEEDNEEIPKKFVPVQPVVKTKAKHNIKNGRVYKILNNGRAMWCDTGETFKL